MRRAISFVSLLLVAALGSALPGYFPMYYDAKAGKLCLEVSPWNSDFLYVNSLPAGVGSNHIGLDRGQIGGSLIIHFERSGPKVWLVAPNQEYRALTEIEPERQTARESFAQSLIRGLRRKPQMATGFWWTRREPLGALYRSHEELPEEYGS